VIDRKRFTVSEDAAPDPSCAAAAAAVRGARRMVAFTGAGVSTESGLPDFRSPGGMWASIDPVKVASRSAALRSPKRFYEFYRTRLEMLAFAAPNPAHIALARLEQAGMLRTIVTQNVDGLHQLAGSRSVVELHGNLRESACMSCDRVFSIALVRGALDAGTLPACETCGGMLKPNVVLFEEPLPEPAWKAAMDAALGCDVMLVVGSSLLVTPAAYVVHEAVEHGARLIIVNREVTPCDGSALAVLRGDAGRFVPALVEAAIGVSTDGEEGFSHAPN
jgi:NAD-dependent deacetylase